MDTTSGYTRRLAVEIAVLLAVKLALLTCLWWAFFSPEHRVRVEPDGVDDRLLSRDRKEPETP